MKSYLIAFLFIIVSAFSLVGQSTRQPLDESERIGDFSGIVYDICFSKSGKSLVVPQDNQIFLYDVESRKLIRQMAKGHMRPILCIDLSLDSTIVVSGGLDSMTIVWNVRSGEVIQKLNYHHGVVTALNISPDGNLLATGSSDKTVVVYDLTGKKIVCRLNDIRSEITAVRFTPDGQIVAVATQGKQIRLYNALNGKLISLLNGHKTGVRGLSFNKPGTQLFSCGDDSRLISWDISNLNQIRILSVENYGSDWLLSVDANKDTDAQVVAGLDSKICVITNYGVTTRKIGVSVNKILFQPEMGNFLKLAVATRGKGVYVIDTILFLRKE